MSYEFEPEDISITAWPPGSSSWFIHRVVHGIRVVHLPTGTVVTCDSERSQHRNRELALQQLWDEVKDKPTYAELAAKVALLNEVEAEFFRLTKDFEDDYLFGVAVRIDEITAMLKARNAKAGS